MIRGLLVVAVSALAIWLSGLASTARGAEFACRDRVLNDYSRPLEMMPEDRLPGPDLPFAPKGVGLSAGEAVVVAGEPISYTLTLRRPVSGDGHVVRPARLNWEISMRVDAVDRLGRPIDFVGQRRWRVGMLRYPERQFKTFAVPGLYRVAVKIRRMDGSTLANYRQFLRVLPRRQKLIIGIHGSGPFPPGETIAARVENQGTLEAQLTNGTALTVEHLENGAWKRVDADEPPNVMFEDPEFLAGGRASPCSFFTVPSDSESGLFRFSVPVEVGSREPRTIVRQFGVS